MSCLAEFEELRKAAPHSTIPLASAIYFVGNNTNQLNCLYFKIFSWSKIVKLLASLKDFYSFLLRFPSLGHVVERFE